MSAVLGSHRAEHEKNPQKNIPPPGGNRQGEDVKEVLYIISGTDCCQETTWHCGVFGQVVFLI